MFFNKTKYYLVTYSDNNGAFGNSTFKITGTSPYLNLNYTLNWIKDRGAKQPIITNIMEINQNQYNEFYDWVSSNKNNYVNVYQNDGQ